MIRHTNRITEYLPPARELPPVQQIQPEARKPYGRIAWLFYGAIVGVVFVAISQWLAIALMWIATLYLASTTVIWIWRQP